MFNYDFPRDRETYLHRIGRAGRFATGGIAISFLSQEEDRAKNESTMKDVQDKFQVLIKELPSQLEYLPTKMIR